jgi:hypothetical protein
MRTEWHADVAAHPVGPPGPLDGMAWPPVQASVADPDPHTTSDQETSDG